MSTALTHAELSSLRDHEATIRQHEIGFVAVGLAITAINADKLFRDQYDTFAAYILGEWGWSRGHAFRLIEGSRVYRILSPIGDTTPRDRLPANEAQIRPLTTIPLEQVEGVWREVVSVAPLDDDGNPKITAALVQETVNLHKGDPKPTAQASNDDLPETLQATTGDVAPAAEVDEPDQASCSCGESDRNDDGDCVSCLGADAYDAEDVLDYMENRLAMARRNRHGCEDRGAQ